MVICEDCPFPWKLTKAGGGHVHLRGPEREGAFQGKLRPRRQHAPQLPLRLPGCCREFLMWGHWGPSPLLAVAPSLDPRGPCRLPQWLSSRTLQPPGSPEPGTFGPVGLSSLHPPAPSPSCSPDSSSLKSPGKARWLHATESLDHAPHQVFTSPPPKHQAGQRGHALVLCPLPCDGEPVCCCCYYF